MWDLTADPIAVYPKSTQELFQDGARRSTLLPRLAALQTHAKIHCLDDYADPSPVDLA